MITAVSGWFYKMIIFLGSGTFAVLGNIILKRGVNKITAGVSVGFGLAETLWKFLTSQDIILGFLLYGIGAVLYLKLLSLFEVTKIYPLLTAYMFVVLIILGNIVLKEPVSFLRIIGLVAMICGIFLIIVSK